MGTTTGSFNWYDTAKLKIADGTIDLDTDSLIMLLTTNTHVPAIATDEFLTDIDNEVSGSGYARQTLAGVTLTAPGPNGKVKWDCTDPVFTATGGSIVNRYWHIFSNANGSDATRELIAYGLCDATPADVTTTTGNTLTCAVNASGLAEIGG